MTNQGSTAHDQQALKAGAHQLQRAAGKVLEHACAADDPATLGVALAHIEEALDRLSVGMLQAAHAVTVANGPAHQSCLEPSAEALCFHLRLTAERLREPQLACESSRFWTRRLVGSAASGDRYEPVIGWPPDASDTVAEDRLRPATPAR